MPAALPRFVAPRARPAEATQATPAAPQYFPRFQAPVPPQPPAAPTPPATPVSLAGAGIPAALTPTAPARLAPPLPDEPLAGRLGASRQPVASVPPQAPPPPPRTPGGTSAAPPGFHATRVVIAESAELLALDPSLDDEDAPADAIGKPDAPAVPPTPNPFAATSWTPAHQDAPPAPMPTAAPVSGPAPVQLPAGFDPSQLTPEEVASLAGPLRVELPTSHEPAVPAPAPAPAPAASPTAPPAEIGGSRLAGRALSVLPRRGDLAAARARDLRAVGRLILAFVAVAIVVIVAGSAVADALEPVPIIGSAVDTLRALALYPRVYGVEWITATLAIVSLAGVIFAHMEQQAERHGMRKDPERRLNIALATLIVLTLGSGAMSMFHARGWAASAAATGFFLALCLAMPLARTPGARAMRSQPDRGWALLFLVAVPAVVLAATIPTLVIAALAFTHVRTRWSHVVENTDEHAEGPLDGGSRRGALAITLAVVIVASIGFNAMHQSSADLRDLQKQERTSFPGATEGPTIDEPTP